MSLNGQKLRDGGWAYQEDEEKIQKLGQALQYKWGPRLNNLSSDAKARRRILDEFETEAKNRFLELGFITNIDVTPTLAGYGPPDIAIVRKIYVEEPDHDKVRHEVKKQARKDGLI